MIEGMDNPALKVQTKLTRFGSLKELLNVMNTITAKERHGKNTQYAPAQK